MIPNNDQDSLFTTLNSPPRYLSQHNNEKINRNNRISFKDETRNNNTFLYPNSKHIDIIDYDKNNSYDLHAEHIKKNGLKINTLSDINITLSPPTGTTTPPSNRMISSLYNLSRSATPSLISEEEEPPTVKVTCDMSNNNNSMDDDSHDIILKTGRLLCCKKSVWYTSRQQRHRRKLNKKKKQQEQEQQKEIHRQETYLTWREFHTILKPHCLELYFVSPYGLRLAHIIYFKYHDARSYKLIKKRSIFKTKLKSIFNTTITNSNDDDDKNKSKKKKNNLYPSFRQQWKQYKLQYKHRHRPKISYLQLSLASLSDYTIQLEHENKTGGINTFLLQGQNAFESQSWYMALYHLIPYKPHLLFKGKTTKKPIPPFIDVDIFIPSLRIKTLTSKDNHHDKKKRKDKDELSIRLPLDQVIHQDSYSHIQAIDLKNCLIRIINHFQSQNNNHHRDHLMNQQDPPLNPSTLALCWRYNQRIEWISDTCSIISPQLIEKKHVLELRSILPQNGQVLEAPLPMEGFLIQSTNENGEFKKRHKQSKMYAMTDGHYLFLIDPSKAILPNQSEQQKKGWSLNWLSAVTLMDLHHNRNKKNSNNHHNNNNNNNNNNNTHGVHERMNHLFQSVPGFFTKPHHGHQQQKPVLINKNENKNSNNINNNSWIENEISSSMSTTITTTNENMDHHYHHSNSKTATATTKPSSDLSRRAKQINYSFAVIDLSFIDCVQAVRTNPINIPTAAAAASSSGSSPTSTSPLRTFSGSSASTFLSMEVINELNKRRKRLFELKLNDKTCIQFEAPNAQAMFEWIHRLRKIIKYGQQCRKNGIIMSQAISNLWYCHTHKSILQSSILYVRKDSQKTYRRYLCVLTKGKGLILYRYNKTYTMMTKKRVIRLNNKSTYSFGLNHAMDLKSEDAPSAMMTTDGERTRDQVHQCAFVIWQRFSFSTNPYIMQIKEYIGLMKLGHRLGRKGASFIFLTSTVEEKEAWLWALQHEIGPNH